MIRSQRIGKYKEYTHDIIRSSQLRVYCIIRINSSKPEEVLEYICQQSNEKHIHHMFLLDPLLGNPSSQRISRAKQMARLYDFWLESKLFLVTCLVGKGELMALIYSVFLDDSDTELYDQVWWDTDLRKGISSVVTASGSSSKTKAIVSLARLFGCRDNYQDAYRSKILFKYFLNIISTCNPERIVSRYIYAVLSTAISQGCAKAIHYDVQLNRAIWSFLSKQEGLNIFDKTIVWTFKTLLPQKEYKEWHQHWKPN